MDTTWGSDNETGLTDADILAIRAAQYEGKPIELIASDYGVAIEIIALIVDGHVLPYIGGPLRPLPLQGCNPKQLEATKNRQRFVRGVIQCAAATLTDMEFEVFCNFNGMRVTDAKQYLHNSEPVNERLAIERYRSVIRRHATGAGIEEAVSQHAKRSR